MDITDIRLTLATKEGAIKAFGSFTLDGEFAVRGVRVMEDKNGKNFVAFPSRSKGNGEYEDLAFPISKELYHKIDQSVVAEYNNLKEHKDLVERYDALEETFAEKQNERAMAQKAENQESAETKTENQEPVKAPATKKSKSR